MILILRHASPLVEHVHTKSWVCTTNARFTRHSTILHPSQCVRCLEGGYTSLKHQELSQSRIKTAWTTRSNSHGTHHSYWLLTGIPLNALDYIQ